jgi:hypothetical protein
LFNSIFLNTIAKGNYSFDSTQQAQLESIAFQCPFKGGNAVYKARSLYVIIKDTTYNDSLYCANAEKRSRFSDPENGANEQLSGEGDKKKGFKLYPNPASNALFLDYSIQMQGTLALFDSNGKEVKRIPLNKGLSKA